MRHSRAYPSPRICCRLPGMSFHVRMRKLIETICSSLAHVEIGLQNPGRAHTSSPVLE